MSKPSRSEIVKALADIASQGTYQVKPAMARQMNAVFEWTAQLINELEADERREEKRAALSEHEEVDNDFE